MTKTTESTTSALATANWWADQVFGGTIGNSGDGMTMALAVVAGAQGVPAASDKRAGFVARLSAHIDAALERMRDRDHPSITLGCDYGPEATLADIASSLGISSGSFPWKTTTWTYPTHAVASLGYGAASRLIWQAEDWERPACGAAKYGSGPDGVREPWKCSALMYHEGSHVFDTPEPLCQADAAYGDGPCLRPSSRHTTDGYGVRHAFQS